MGVKERMARRAKQQSFEGTGLKKPSAMFGGSLLKGNPKGKRPLDSKLPILITLRAEKSLLRTPKAHGKVNKLVYDTAKKYGVRVYEFENVGNHLHALVRVPRLSLWAPFIRELTGQIAQAVGEIFPLSGKFWKFRPHTRIVQGWKKAYQIAKDYIFLNQLEAEGLINRREIKTLKDLRAIFSG